MWTYLHSLFPVINFISFCISHSFIHFGQFHCINYVVFSSFFAFYFQLDCGLFVEVLPSRLRMLGLCIDRRAYFPVFSRIGIELNILYRSGLVVGGVHYILCCYYVSYVSHYRSFRVFKVLLQISDKGLFGFSAFPELLYYFVTFFLLLYSKGRKKKGLLYVSEWVVENFVLW